MSYHIEYRFVASRVPGAQLTDGIDRFFVCIEGGDSRHYEGGRRARSWRVPMLGTIEEILEQACYFAVGCDEGLRINGRPCEPEAYIRKIRKLVEAASASEKSIHTVPIVLKHRCPPGDPAEALLESKGVPKTAGTSYLTSKPEAHFNFVKADGTTDFRTFFKVFADINRYRVASMFAECPDFH